MLDVLVSDACPLCGNKGPVKRIDIPHLGFTMKRCLDCNGLGIVEDEGETWYEWQGTVGRQIERGNPNNAKS